MLRNLNVNNKGKPFGKDKNIGLKVDIVDKRRKYG